MWLQEHGKLVKEFKFNDFKTAMLFINKVAKICHKANHHPEIYNCYAYVKLSFCTHDSGDHITEKDHQLTRLIDKIKL